MKFEVQTLSADHMLGRELVEARDEAEARALVRSRGLTAAMVRPAGALADLGALGGGRRSFNVALFSQEPLLGRFARYWGKRANRKKGSANAVLNASIPSTG